MMYLDVIIKVQLNNLNPNFDSNDAVQEFLQNTEYDLPSTENVEVVKTELYDAVQTYPNLNNNVE